MKNFIQRTTRKAIFTFMCVTSVFAYASEAMYQHNFLSTKQTMMGEEDQIRVSTIKKIDRKAMHKLYADIQNDRSLSLGYNEDGNEQYTNSEANYLILRPNNVIKHLMIYKNEYNKSTLYVSKEDKNVNFSSSGKDSLTVKNYGISTSITKLDSKDLYKMGNDIIKKYTFFNHYAFDMPWVANWDGYEYNGYFGNRYFYFLPSRVNQYSYPTIIDTKINSSNDSIELNVYSSLPEQRINFYTVGDDQVDLYMINGFIKEMDAVLAATKDQRGH